MRMIQALSLDDPRVAETGPFVHWEKPQWDELFMGMAYMISTMSPDPATKHGAIIVNQFKHVVSLGFNGYPPDCVDEDMPKTRDNDLGKYHFTEHSETNALHQANCDVSGMTMYVTGHPCYLCFRAIACRRIARVIYDPTIDTACFSELDKKRIEKMNKSKEHPGAPKVAMVPFVGDPTFCMQRVAEYIRVKREMRKLKA